MGNIEDHISPEGHKNFDNEICTSLPERHMLLKGEQKC